MKPKRPLHQASAIKCAALGLLAGLALSACSSAQAGSEPAVGWVRECPGNAFCFTRPATLVVQPTQVIDSLAATYRGGGISLTFDLARFDTSVDHLVKPARQGLMIDGRPADLLTSEREIVLVVPKVHDGVLGTIKLNMALKFEGKASRELALRIFQSIEFKPPR